MLDTQKILSPLSAQQPCGPSMVYSDTFDKLNQLRPSTQLDLPKGLWTAKEKVGDWYQVQNLCVHILETQSKDLQIVFWLCEALFFNHKLPGLIQGLKILRNLLENFWKDLHPQKNSPQDRSLLFEWFDRSFAGYLLSLPISSPQLSDQSAFLFQSYLLLSFKKNKTKTKDTTFEQLEQSVRSTPQAFYLENLKDLTTCLDLLQLIEQICTSRSQESGLLNLFQKRLEELKEIMAHLKTKAHIEPKPHKKIVHKLTEKAKLLFPKERDTPPCFQYTTIRGRKPSKRNATQPHETSRCLCATQKNCDLSFRARTSKPCSLYSLLCLFLGGEKFFRNYTKLFQ